MKRLLLLLMGSLFLVACGNKESDGPLVERSEQDGMDASEDEEIETLSIEQIKLTLSDNEDLKIDLLNVRHGRSDMTDHVSLKIKIENKQNKTFELFLKEMSVDGKKIEPTQSWLSDDEVKPNESIETIINGYEYEELTVVEHIAGAIIYKDYEGNRNEITFNEYINE